jgi:hypothetical protein
MSRRAKFTIVGALGSAVLVGGVLAAVSHHAEAGFRQAAGRPARANAVSSVTSTITINSQIGMTFAPAPPGAVPALTAEQAWAQEAGVEGSSGTTIPSNVTVQLGLLTLPAGPANSDTSGLVTSNGTAYTALNELAYGYSWHSCPMSTLPNATLPPNPCIEWEFLDANTGHLIDDTWQMG